MKEVIAHSYSNTKEQLKEIVDLLENNGYEVAYENEYQTAITIIKEVADEE